MPGEFPRAGVKQEWLENHPLLAGKWYHRVELSPGNYTPGKARANLAVARELVKRCEIEGQKVLDIGAMDGLMSLLAMRRGAERVVTYDRVDLSPRLGFLKNVFGIEFDYLNGFSLQDLPEKARELGVHPFDVVFFCGVLYHMFDPMAGLAVARGLVRNGGLMVIETAAVIDSGFKMHFNAGRFFSNTNYWLMSLDCLDYLCKFLRLEPLGCSWVGGYELHGDLQGCRIAVVCRAVQEAPKVENDEWFERMAAGDFAIDVDLGEYLDVDQITGVGGRDLEYGPVQDNLVRHADSGTVDILGTVEQTPPLDPWQPLGSLALGSLE